MGVISELTSTPSSPLHHLHTRCVLLCVCCCCPQWLMSWPRQESGTRGRWSGRETVHMLVRQMAAVKSDGSDHRDLVALRRPVFLLNLEDPVSAVFLDAEMAAVTQELEEEKDRHWQLSGSVRVCNSSPAIAVEISSFTRCPTATTVTWIALQIKDVVSRMLG